MATDCGFFANTHAQSNLRQMPHFKGSVLISFTSEQAKHIYGFAAEQLSTN